MAHIIPDYGRHGAGHRAHDQRMSRAGIDSLAAAGRRSTAEGAVSANTAASAPRPAQNQPSGGGAECDDAGAGSDAGQSESEIVIFGRHPLLAPDQLAAENRHGQKASAESGVADAEKDSGELVEGWARHLSTILANRSLWSRLGKQRLLFGALLGSTSAPSRIESVGLSTTATAPMGPRSSRPRCRNRAPARACACEPCARRRPPRRRSPSLRKISASAGTRITLIVCGRRNRTVAYMPGSKAPSELSTSKTVSMVREVGSTALVVLVTRAGKLARKLLHQKLRRLIQPDHRSVALRNVDENPQRLKLRNTQNLFGRTCCFRR